MGSMLTSFLRSVCYVCLLFFNMSNIPQGKYDNTIKECTKALELNPVYIKALVRRGEAHEKLEHFEEAIAGEFKFYCCMEGNYTNL